MSRVVLTPEGASHLVRPGTLVILRVVDETRNVGAGAGVAATLLLPGGQS